MCIKEALNSLYNHSLVLLAFLTRGPHNAYLLVFIWAASSCHYGSSRACVCVCGEGFLFILNASFKSRALCHVDVTCSVSHSVIDEQLTRPGVHRRFQNFLVTFLCTIQQRWARPAWGRAAHRNVDLFVHPQHERRDDFTFLYIRTLMLLLGLCISSASPSLNLPNIPQWIKGGFAGLFCRKHLCCCRWPPLHYFCILYFLQKKKKNC